MRRMTPGPVQGLWQGSIAVVAVLLSFAPSVGAQVRGREADREARLVEAVRSSRVADVRVELDRGAKPTPLALYIAVGLRDPAILEMLIEAGGNVEERARIREGMELTPLFGAAMAGRADMIRVLLDAGANPATTSTFGRMDMTPLEAATMGKHAEAVGLLNEVGARLDMSGIGGVISEQAMVTAIQDSDIDGVQSMLDAGVSVNGLLVSNTTPLSLAAGYARGRLPRQEEMVSFLIRVGADVNLRNADGSTAFMHAARRGGTKIMSLLLDAGADPDARDADGRHAITYANGYDAAAEIVLESSADLQSYGSAPRLQDGGAYSAGTYSGPCGKSGAPPSQGMPDAEGGVTTEITTLIRSPDGSRTGAMAPECAPMVLSQPGTYTAQTRTCTSTWTVRDHTLRETSGASTTLAYIHEDASCSDETFAFSIAAEALDTGTPERCSTARLTITMPANNEQFAFDDADTARVEIPLQAFAHPEDCAEEIVWEAPDIEGVDKQIFSGVGPGGAGPGAARLVYWKLPASNDAFGPITIRATMGAQAEDVEVQLFYDPLATNHPEQHPSMSPLGYDGLPGDSVPNWYFYWTQTAAMLPAAQDMTYYVPEVEGANNPLDVVAARYDPVDEVVLISQLVYDRECRGRVDPASLRPLGVSARGIDCFGETMRHEYHHREEDVAWWRTGASSWFYIGGFIRTIRSQFLEDEDGDLVPKDVEAAFGDGCSDERRRSCNRLPFPDVTDLEINAYYVGWQKWRLRAADPQDWSKCGKQWTAGGC